MKKELKTIKTKLNDNQIDVISKASDKLNVSFDELLRFLIDVEIERMLSFVEISDVEDYLEKLGIK